VIALIGLGGVAAVALLVLAARRPVLARIAVRNVGRRRGEAALVVLGAMLGTAIIIGSLLVGDTLDASIRATVPDQLGPVDVLAAGATPVSTDAVVAALTASGALDGAGVDGLMEATRTPATVATEAGADRRAEPGAQLVELDFPAAAAFGGDPGATGLSGATPERGRAVAGADLADALGLQPGDAVTAYAYGSSVELVVDRVVPRTGVAGLWTGSGPTSPNLFVAPGTVDALVAAAPPQLESVAAPPQRQVLISAEGGVFEGADASSAVVAAVEAATAGIDGVEITGVKAEVLDAAEAEGDSFGQLFLAVGSFAVAAGVLLLVNIFVMLAEERKSELGLLRAVSLTRGGLVSVLALEGALYALASALVGALAGIGVGRAIVAVTASIFATFGDLSLTFSAPPSSIATGALVGFLLSIATVLGTSLRIARLNVIRAIRDLPEPTDRVGRRWTLVVAALVAAAAGLAATGAISGEDPVGTMVLPALAVSAVGVLAARLLPRRLVVSLTSGAVLVWALVYEQVAGTDGGDINEFVVQGMLLSFSAVALVSQHQELVGAAARRLGGGGSLTARLGLAYPLARRFRTGMTLAMYSLIVFTLVFMSVLANLFGSQVDSTTAGEGGGFDLVVDSSTANPISDDAVGAAEGVAGAAGLLTTGVEFGIDGGEGVAWPLSGFDQRFIDLGALPLEEYDQDRFGSQAEVWDAVAADPSLVVADAFFLQGDGGPAAPVAEVGDRLTLRDPATGAQVERTIAATTEAGMTRTGVLASRESVEQASVRRVANRFYVVADDGADPVGVAAKLQGEFVDHGVQADAFRAIVEENVQVNLQFLRLMQGYLALGLVVGIAGLGVIMVRAVRERRRQVGMLRSLGVQASTVRSIFVLESAFVALEGTLIGTALALVTAYQIVTSSDDLGDFDAGFSVPWLQVSVVLGVALVASVLATATPAAQASRIRPAVALRIAD